MFRPLQITLARSIAAAWGALLVQAPIAASQTEHPEQRLASIVGVAVGEYAKGVDPSGRLVAADELDEAVGFLQDAKPIADRLSGDRAPTIRATLDTLLTVCVAHRPPADVRSVYARFVQAMGSAGALELPPGGVDVGAGQAIYAARCASCHGATGDGNGPMAQSLPPATRPPPFAGAAGIHEMYGVSPALMFRVISVGVRSTPMPAWASTLSAADRWNLVAYLTAMRSTPAAVREGEEIFRRRCAACRGATDIGSFAWQAERSDSQIVAAIATHDLTPTDATNLVAFIRTLPTRPQTPAHVVGLLDSAMVAARAGHTTEAADRAFDSYIAFEPLETPAGAKNPGLVAAMERHFADFKGAIRANNLPAASRARDEIQVGLPAIVDLAQPTDNPWSAFLQSFLIILREGFEAILVVGAVVAFLIKLGHREQLRAIWVGSGLGVLASVLTAVVLATVLHAIPASSEIIEGITLLAAVVVLFSVSYWLISRVEAAHWQKFIRERVTAALEHGGGRALGFVAFLAVYREGAEVALFYQALFHQGGQVAIPLILGIVVGGIALAGIFTLFYHFGLRIPLRPFFAVTSAFLYYMAFVFAGAGIRELQEGNVLPVTLIPGAPHIEAMGIFPSAETLGAQLVLVGLLLFALAKTFWSSRRPPAPPAPSMPPPARRQERRSRAPSA